MIKKFFAEKKSFGSPDISHKGKELEVNNWVISEFVVQKLYPVAGVHPFPLNELMLMSAAVCYFRPQYIFEWGTNIGKSARIFYEISEAFGYDTEIHSIDLPDDVYHNEHPQQDRGRLVKGFKRVTLHQADGLDRSFSIIREKKPTGKVLFFVDGDHSYESVKRELGAILETVPDAAVLLHDTFYQSEESNYNIGPYKAVKEITETKPNYKVISTNTGLPGMTLVFPK